MRTFSGTIAVIMCSTLLAATQAWGQCTDWNNLLAKQDCRIYSTAYDRFGNKYIVGAFSNTSLDIGSVSLPPLGFYSAFIVKLDKNMNALWGRSYGGTDVGKTIIVDGDDNVIMAGDMHSPTLTFDCITLTNTGSWDTFLVKYTQEGAVQWAIQSTGSGDEVAVELKINSQNHIILAGVMVGGFQMGGTSIAGNNSYDSFLFSFSPSGTVEWGRRVGHATAFEPDYILAMDIDSDDNILITGFFESPSISFDSFIIPRNTLSENYFTVKLNSSGSALWARGTTGNSDVAGYDIAVNKQNEVFVVGRFQTNPVQFEGQNINNQGEADIFIVKYDEAGQLLATKSYGGPGFESGSKLEITDSDELILSGFFYSPILSLDGNILTKADTRSDAFVARMDNALTITCLSQISGDAENFILDLEADVAGNLWMVVENGVGEGSTLIGGTYDLHDDRINTVLVSLGSNLTFDTPGPPNAFAIDLGPDRKICPGETLMLSVPQMCSSQYLWSNASSLPAIEVSSAGTYWVKVTSAWGIGMDTITIHSVPQPQIELGPERVLCPGQTISFAFTPITGVSFLWNDGVGDEERDIQTAGVYSLKLINACGSTSDTLTVTTPPKINLNLGPDRSGCEGQKLEVGVQHGVSYKWQNGETGPSIQVTKSGVYQLTAQTACESVTSEVKINVIESTSGMVPNVVTANGDHLNDQFQLPDGLSGAAVTIMNRWGQTVYSTSHYENSWPPESISTGVYYYYIQGACHEPIKGYVQVIR